MIVAALEKLVAAERFNEAAVLTEPSIVMLKVPVMACNCVRVMPDNEPPRANAARSARLYGAT
jgi:hypothetical protein